MSLNAVSNIPDPYLQSLYNNALSLSAANSTTAAAGSGNVDPSSLALPQDSSAQLSPFAQMLTSLQNLQQSDPARYKQVTAQIATDLQDAAKTATADGNTAQAGHLNQLSTDFSKASQDGSLPNIGDLAKAAGGAHGHHHHHMGPPPSSSGDSTDATDPNDATTAGDLSKQISAFLANSTSSAPGSALDPMSIIGNVLNSGGVSL